MEAILVDVKRAMRSLQGMMHAVSGALRQNGVGKGVLGAVRHGKKTVGVDATRDVYGKPGKVDIYSGRDVVELYRKMAFNDRPLP